MKFAFFLALAAGIAQATDLSLLEKHRDHFAEHIKTYDVELEGSDDFEARLSIFARNMDYIDAHNAGNSTFTLGQNQFTHLSFEEFSGMYLSSMPESEETNEVNDFANMKAADSVDWSKTSAVTPVKNQGACGSCWAFSTTGALEGAYFLKNKKQVSFSEQQLVSCDKGWFIQNNGCNGGLMDGAFQWIGQNGLCTEKDYPYTSGNGMDGSCLKSCTTVEGTKGMRYTDVSNSEDALAKALTQQPIAVGVDADENWQHYRGGILTTTEGTQLDHGVLAVGFGSERGQDFWKIKNSWAAGWGEDGYIRILRNVDQRDGPCGITAHASYPTL